MLYIIIFTVFLPTYRINLNHSYSVSRKKKQLIAQHYSNLISKI